jgi:hypothetical protein
MAHIATKPVAIAPKTGARIALRGIAVSTVSKLGPKTPITATADQIAIIDRAIQTGFLSIKILLTNIHHQWCSKFPYQTILPSVFVLGYG